MDGGQALEIARPLAIPYEADSVLEPEILYGPEPTALFYTTPDDEIVRVTFEGLDSLRVCRGEYLPYEDHDSPETVGAQLFTVENSRWLLERYAYEARWYRDCYEWGGDVDEMLTDYDHYLFRFHDEFVEAIAAGIWFEKHPRGQPFTDAALSADHPLVALPAVMTTGRFEVAGIGWQIRTNPKPVAEILRDALYCSQPLYQFARELDGSANVSYRLDVRKRRGVIKSSLRNCMGTVQTILDGVATLEQARELVEPLIRAVREGRREMEE